MAKNITNETFEKEYRKLNAAQKEAVDSIGVGPVMVVAGPGTGKTQILALRIANILQKTDTKVDGVLCLTFTNSAVEAMKERLIRYIGEPGKEAKIFTFHSFGLNVIQEHFSVLGFPQAPKLLEDAEAAIFFSSLLEENEWQYLRPRSDSTRYLSDLRSLISLMKRERIKPEDFSEEVEKEIKFLKEDESNISSRGESKGQLKQEALKKIEGLEKNEEIVKFLKVYEQAKKEKNVIDYDDVLELLLQIVEMSPDALSEMRERYLYVLVDEHQDSSRVQNEFLARVWSEVEKPDIFVVGDDRQLIYGFSGASIEHFKGFKKTFPGAKIVALLDNYRSTQVILDAAHALLKSVMSDRKLVSTSGEHHPIRLIEAVTPEDEIFTAGKDIKSKIQEGLDPNDCAILVPKNRQVRSALEILHGLDLPVSTLEALSFFDQAEAEVFVRVLKIINGDSVSLALSFFDQASGIEPLEATTFLAGEKMREFSLDSIMNNSPTLFGASNHIELWIAKLSKWYKDSKPGDLESLIKTVGQELFGEVAGKISLVSGKEITDTVLGLLGPELEKNPRLSLSEFIAYLEKLESSNQDIPLEVAPRKGVKVLTMHSAKGLEFDYVWIAHMDERSLSGGKRMGFALPERIREALEEKDMDAVKRKLYVAITRAKRFCTLSYATESLKGSNQEIANIVSELPAEVFKKEKAEKVGQQGKKVSGASVFPSLVKLAKDMYSLRYVSVSLLNNFFECPWKWYFLNLLQLPQDKAEILEFGIAVHASIDQILKLQSAPSEKDLEKIVNEELGKRGYGDSRTRARVGREVLGVVSRWVKNRFPQIHLNRKTEESVSLSNKNFAHLKIYGKIDLIENLSAKEVRVTDFKTGSAKRKSEIEKLDAEGRQGNMLRQLSMYSYLLENSPKWRGVDVRESRLEFVESKNIKESIYDRVITPKDLELLLRDIEDYDRLIKSGEWIERKCNYNSYGKNTECEYCKLAEVYKGGPLSSQPK